MHHCIAANPVVYGVLLYPMCYHCTNAEKNQTVIDIIIIKANQAIIGSVNDLVPVQCQAIIWINDGYLWIGFQETNFSSILIKISIILSK